MDGYTYLVLQTLPILAVVALIFCLLGVFFGASKYRSRLGASERAREALTNELSGLRKGHAKLEAELKDSRHDLRQMKSGKAKSQGRDLAGDEAAALAPAQSAGDLRSRGKVDLGQVFDSRPDVVDDLKRVRGIAKVMEEKLNALGIYTFAQIAHWSDAAVTEFGERLSIIGNIDRYKWREQCSTLHKEKYHEEP